MRADRTLTERMLVNLSSNAVKFSPPNSTVSMRVAASGAGQVAFSVTDRGQGVSKEMADKMFDKFTRARGGPRFGSGLGLATRMMPA